MEIRKRMCKKMDCKNCGLDSINTKIKSPCIEFIFKYPQEAEKILTDWDKKNPVKTNLSVLLEKFPNVMLHTDGFPNFYPSLMGLEDAKCKNGDISHNIKDCWNLEIE